MVWRLMRTRNWIRRRIDELEPLLQPSERFILVFGFVEKVIRRTFVYLWMSKGKTNKGAFRETARIHSVRGLNEKWPDHDPDRRKLEHLLGPNDWRVVKESARMRDELIHGEWHESQSVYRKQLKDLISVLDRMHGVFSLEYSFDGWKGMDKALRKWRRPTS